MRVFVTLLPCARIALLFVLLCAGCSSGGGPSVGEPAPRAFTVSATPPDTWDALVRVFVGAGLSPATSDRASGLLVSSPYVATRAAPLVGVSNADLFDCGKDMGISIARGPVEVIVSALVAPATGGEQGTALTLTVRPVVRGDNRITTDQPCRSLGTLETEIARRVTSALR